MARSHIQSVARPAACKGARGRAEDGPEARVRATRREMHFLREESGTRGIAGSGGIERSEWKGIGWEGQGKGGKGEVEVG